MSETELSTDGRRARRERGRIAVTDATIDLVFDGETPSVATIARRARVSEATLFRYFDTLDELRRATIDRYIERFTTLFLLPEPPRGTLEERVDHVVAARDRLYTATEPMARLTRSRASFIPELGDELRRMRTLFADQVRRHFAGELDALTPARRDDLVAVVCALTSFESWLELRDVHDRSPLQARRALRESLVRLLTVPPVDRSEQP